MQGEDEGLLAAIEQTIDALTFMQTHVVDNDFRAHSKSTVDSVLSLQEEQRTRVDQAFRAAPASPQYLAAVLLSVYRGEAASVNLARENEPHFLEAGTIDDLSDHQCKAFKKEMKQRIHEWEGAFRDANGREAAPQDKVVLRPIYELYKHAKGRVIRADAVGVGAGAVAQQPQGNYSQRSNQTHQQTYSTIQQTPSRPQSATAQPTPDRNGSSIYNAVTPAAHPSRPSSGTGGSTYSTPSGGQPNYGYQGAASSPVVVAASSPAVATPQTAAAQSGQQHLATPTVTSGQTLTVDELVREKRTIKRLLHQFEASFEERHGRKPAKDDRRDYTREYHRYGELKALLNENAVMSDHMIGT
jgi:hypothetical protein